MYHTRIFNILQFNDLNKLHVVFDLNYFEAADFDFISKSPWMRDSTFYKSLARMLRLPNTVVIH